MARVRASVIGGAVLLGAAVSGFALNTASHAQNSERTVEILVKKFEYVPSEITLRKGEPVRLALTSYDRLHGFSMKALGVHADVKPDETVVVRIVPDKTGTFVFACDVFCGDDHEDMHGVVKVVE
jgi:cytochrome c oxidase subunit 2